MDTLDQQPQSPQPIPQVPQAEPPTQPHFSFKPVYVLLIILLLLLIGGGAYYWLNRSVQKPSVMEELTVERCDVDQNGKCDEKDMQIVEGLIGECRQDTNYNPIVDGDADGCITAQDRVLLFPNEPYTAPADETANWKTYSNKEYSLQYPPGLTVEESGIDVTFYKTNAKGKQQVIAITSQQTTKSSPCSSDLGMGEMCTKVNMYEALFLGTDYDFPEEENEWKASYTMINKNKEYTIKFYELIDNDTRLKILATFTFLDQASQAEEWTTYTGETTYTTDGSSAFSIKYPSGWQRENNVLYPLGKKDDSRNFKIILGAGGHGGPAFQERKTYPAGEAFYYWGDTGSGYIFAYATFTKSSYDYIFEVNDVPLDLSKKYEEIFDKMLSTLTIL